MVYRYPESWSVEVEEGDRHSEERGQLGPVMSEGGGCGWVGPCHGARAAVSPACPRARPTEPHQPRSSVWLTVPSSTRGSIDNTPPIGGQTRVHPRATPTGKRCARETAVRHAGPTIAARVQEERVIRVRIEQDPERPLRLGTDATFDGHASDINDGR
jgi:hypothetical protein